MDAVLEEPGVHLGPPLGHDLATVVENQAWAAKHPELEDE